MAYFTINGSYVRADQSFPIKPINTKNLRRLALTEMPRMSIDVRQNGTRGYISHCLTCSPIRPERLYSFVYGACFLELRTATNIKSFTFSISNSIILCIGQNPDKKETIPLTFFEDNTDCLLLCGLILGFVDFRFEFELYDESELMPSDLKLSFIPLVLDEGKIGHLSNLVGLDFYTRYTNGQYLVYSSGFASIYDELPELNHVINESISVRPSVDSSRKTLYVYSPNSYEIVSEIPDYLVIDRSRHSIDVFPPGRGLSIRPENEQAIREFCLSKDSTCRFADDGCPTFYTEEQEAEMRKLSNKANSIKYRVYCFLQGLSVDLGNLFEQGDPPFNFMSVVLAGL